MSGEKIPTDLAQRRYWIQYRLRLEGWTFADLGRELGITRQTARSVLFKSYPRIEQRIADILDDTPEGLWPERYQQRPESRRKAAV